MNYLHVLTGQDPVITDVDLVVTAQIEQHLGHSSVSMEDRDIDVQEAETVAAFCDQGCGCSLLDGAPCSRQFSLQHYKDMRSDTAELSWGELNMALMGQVMALTCCEETVRRVHHLPSERQRNTTLFQHHGLPVCRRTFLFLHGVGDF